MNRFAVLHLLSIIGFSDAVIIACFWFYLRCYCKNNVSLIVQYTH